MLFFCSTDLHFVYGQFLYIIQSMTKAVRLKKYNDRIEADIERVLLESHGISTFITADDAGGMRPDLMMSTGGVWIWVSDNDVEKSVDILKA